MTSMTIGDAAVEVGISPKAIRYWEAKGLLPEVGRTDSGYRTFEDADLDRLRFIHQAKSLGLTLQEIHNVLQLVQTGESPCTRVIGLLDDHIAAIDESIADLQRLRNTLTEATSMATSPDTPNSASAVCHIIERTG